MAVTNRNAATLTVQEQRHLADYDLSATFVRSDVVNLVDHVEQVIADWKIIRTDPEARFFLMSLLVWQRVRSK